MKKLLAFVLSLTAAAMITTGCSASDGDVDNGSGTSAGRDDSRVTTTTTEEISDKVADGINSGLDKTQSVVDDVLK
ncbi:MAG: hypothetical protein IJ740_08935 [Ruminococcus sp.]|nr:hypothetical protein [Ruminococcus sp.]